MAQRSNLAALLQDAIGTLKAAGFELPILEARALASNVLGLSREQMLAEPAAEVDISARHRFDDAVRRRCAHEPFARIAGEREFWSLSLTLGPDTLVPRPESETVVEAVLEHAPDRGRALSILDLGTGSGCLLLALLSEFPAAHGLGVDCAEGAVTLANANAARLGLASRATFVAGNWGHGLSGPYDIIVCNPPYVAERDRASLEPEVRDFDPPRALFAGADGLAAYRQVVPEIARLLASDGVSVLELGAGQLDSVTELLNRSELLPGLVRCDLAGIPRAYPAAKIATRFQSRVEKKKVGKSCIPV